jgi:hypothetical protein
VPYQHWFRTPNYIVKNQPQEPRVPPPPLEWSYGGDPNYAFGSFFYSYRHGLTQVIVLNSYSNTTVGSVQYQWFERELQHVNRADTPWLIVSFHAPLYTSFLGHVNETEKLEMKHAMEPLFVQYGVNLIVSGHDHAYLRTKSLSLDQVDPTGRAPIYLTLGASGNREHHSSGYRNDTHAEPWVAVRTIHDYGVGHLYVPNATHAWFRWFRDGIEPMESDTPTNSQVFDAVWIFNPHSNSCTLPS